jgi:hypothetical protein
MYFVLQSMCAVSFYSLAHHDRPIIVSPLLLYETAHALPLSASLGRRLHVKKELPSFSPLVMTNFALAQPCGTI